MLGRAIARGVPLVFVLLGLQLSPLSTRAGSSEDSRLIVRTTAPLEFNVTQGDEPVRFKAIVLKNAAEPSVDWTASSTQPWLRIEPASGKLSGHGEAEITLIADAGGISPGIYHGTVEIVIPNSAPHSLPVTIIEKSEFAGVAIANAERTFPPDSGMINVKTQYGAKGDAVSDDTAAIQQAISATVHHPGVGPRIVYFPAGIYVISKPLVEKDLTGEWNSLLTLQGAGRAITFLKLTDNNPLYRNAAGPNAVLQLASQHAKPNGAGNSAFDNTIYDLTIDVGHGNPGAIALDYLGNNYCALRNVTLQSSDPDHSGIVGLALQRYASGPCFMKNVLINGFDYAIRTAHNEYSLTFEDLTILNQRVCGIYNVDNILSIRHLVSKNSVPAVCNQTGSGLVAVIGAILSGGSSNYSAIQNQGTLYARDLKTSGYSSALQSKGEVIAKNSLSEYDSGPAAGPSGEKLSLNLPVQETPYFEDTNHGDWKSVVAYGADPTGKKDSSAAIQAAIDSGASTVYFPTGVYVSTATLHLRGSLRVLEGFGSSLNPAGSLFQSATEPAPLLQIDSGKTEVAVNHMRIAAFYPRPVPGVIGIEQDSARPLVLRDSIIGAPPLVAAYQNTQRGSGTLFVENVAAMPWQILFPQNVFARQLNPEGNSTKITNRGGSLWILGLKTEGIGTNIDTEQGGSTELVGGLIYPLWKIPADRAAFVVSDSRASLIYAVSNYKAPTEGGNFAIQIEETQHGATKALPSRALPARGRGTMVPLYRSADFSSHSAADFKSVRSSH